MITKTLHQSFRLTKEDRITQWSLIRMDGFIRPFFTENWLRILAAVTTYCILNLIVGETLYEELSRSLGFAVGFPLILGAFYFVIWSVREREWREAVHK